MAVNSTEAPGSWTMREDSSAASRVTSTKSSRPPGFTSRAADGGDGLGLYLVRLIAMEHGGSVQAASQLGSGSTFTITLPLA